MIIKCPQCEKKFQADETKLKEKESVKLRCVLCRHIWTYTPDQKDLSPHAEEGISQTQSAFSATSLKVTQVKPKGTNIIWTLYLIVLLLLVPTMLVLMRNHVVEVMPQTEKLYETLGLPLVNRTEYFTFKDLTYTNNISEEGLKIKIKGTIKYEPNREEARTVPPVQVNIYGKGDCDKQSWWDKVKKGVDPFIERGLCKLDSWTFMTSDNLALPGEEIDFNEEKFYPEESILPDEISLEFIEK